MSQIEKWFVEIVDDATGRVEKRLEYASERFAQKADDGVNINLDHSRFYTRIVSDTPQKDRASV